MVIQTYKGVVEIFHLNMQHNHEISRDDAGTVSRQPRRPRAAIANSTKPEDGVAQYAYVGTPGKSPLFKLCLKLIKGRCPLLAYVYLRRHSPEAS